MLCDAMVNVTIAVPFSADRLQNPHRTLTQFHPSAALQPSSTAATLPKVSLNEAHSSVLGVTLSDMHRAAGLVEVRAFLQPLSIETATGQGAKPAPRVRYELASEAAAIVFPVPDYCCSMQYVDEQPAKLEYTSFLVDTFHANDTGESALATIDAETIQLPIKNEEAVGIASMVLSDLIISRLGPDTKALHLIGCTTITAAVRFSHLPFLSQLNVSGNMRISDATVASIPRSVQALFLGGCTAITEDVRLMHLPALTTVDLSSTQVSDAGIASLPCMVKELLLNDCTGITAAVRFDHLPALEKVWLSGCASVSDSGVRSLPRSVTLLHLEGCTSISATVSFAHLPSLEELWLTGAVSTSDSVASSLAPSVKLLSFHGCTASTTEFVDATATTEFDEVEAAVGMT